MSQPVPMRWPADSPGKHDRIPEQNKSTEEV